MFLDSLLKPTLLACNVKGGVLLVSKVKFPSKSVDVPIEVPVIVTLAPGIGSFVLESITLPVMVV